MNLTVGRFSLHSCAQTHEPRSFSRQPDRSHNGSRGEAQGQPKRGALQNVFVSGPVVHASGNGLPRHWKSFPGAIDSTDRGWPNSWQFDIGNAGVGSHLLEFEFHLPLACNSKFVPGGISAPEITQIRQLSPSGSLDNRYRRCPKKRSSISSNDFLVFAKLSPVTLDGRK
jgi:hypothetical protein